MNIVDNQFATRVHIVGSSIMVPTDTQRNSSTFAISKSIMDSEFLFQDDVIHGDWIETDGKARLGIAVNNEIIVPFSAEGTVGTGLELHIQISYDGESMFAEKIINVDSESAIISQPIVAPYVRVVLANPTDGFTISSVQAFLTSDGGAA